MTVTTHSLQTLEKFFSSLKTSQTPALIWYSHHNERIELSGRVLENWISKTANFLIEECDVAAGTWVEIGMSAHWRSLVIALASWRVGATLWSTVNEPCPHPLTVGFFSDKEQLTEFYGELPVLVDTAPLATRFLAGLPEGAIDYCAEIRSYADTYSQLETPYPADQALPQLSYSELQNQAAQRAQDINDAVAHSTQPQAHAIVPHREKFSAHHLYTETLAILATGRAVVVLDQEVNWTDEELHRILHSERALQL